VLGAEEDDTAAGDCEDFLVGDQEGGRKELLVMASSRRSSSTLEALRRSSTMFRVGNSRPIIGVTSSKSNLSRMPLGFSGSLACMFGLES
jgi:hypothetical protein